MRSATKPERDAADDAEAEHQRQHFGAARHAVAEVAAIGDDMHLRHRHRHAAGDAGDAQQHLQRARRERRVRLPERRRGAGGVDGRDRRDGAAARPAAACVTQQNRPMPIWVARQPSAGDEMLHQRRPDDAGEIVAGGGDGDRDAAPAHEPMRDVGHQRPEASPSSRRRSAGRARARTAVRLVDIADARDSRARSATLPSASGAAMPKRSARRPINTPPPAKPIMAACRAARPPARSTPNSAWIAGSATTTDHMPTPPMVRQQQSNAEPQPGGSGVDRVRSGGIRWIHGLENSGGDAVCLTSHRLRRQKPNNSNGASLP